MSDKAGLKRLLILDDDADFRKLLVTYLRKIFEGADIVEYDPVARGVPGEDFDWSVYDVLILDYYLCIHNVTGLDILQANRKNRLFPATIMLTGAGNEEVAVRAIKAGVYDYLRKENLDKDQLRKAILDAFEKHKVEQQRLNELTNQSHAFNKGLFYQELEQGHEDEPGKDRVLLLIQLDGHQDLEEKFGIIMRDNIVRHMAKQSFDIFQLGDCNPHITRLSDDCVALIIDDPGSAKTLEFNISGLCTHLKKHPYKFDEKRIRFTVSVGVVPIPRTGRTADILIGRARQACAVAARETGNSFHINMQVVEPVAIPAVESPAIPPETTTAAATVTPEPATVAATVTSEPATVAATVTPEPAAVAATVTPEPAAVAATVTLDLEQPVPAVETAPASSANEAEDLIEPPVTGEVADFVEPPATIEVEDLAEPPATIEVQDLAEPPATIGVEDFVEPPAAIVVEDFVEPPAAIVVEDFVEPPAAIGVEDFVEPPAAIGVEDFVEPPAAAGPPAATAPATGIGDVEAEQIPQAVPEVTLSVEPALAEEEIAAPAPEPATSMELEAVPVPVPPPALTLSLAEPEKASIPPPPAAVPAPAAKAGVKQPSGLTLTLEDLSQPAEAKAVPPATPRDVAAPGPATAAVPSARRAEPAGFNFRPKPAAAARPKPAATAAKESAKPVVPAVAPAAAAKPGIPVKAEPTPGPAATVPSPPTPAPAPRTAAKPAAKPAAPEPPAKAVAPKATAKPVPAAAKATAAASTPKPATSAPPATATRATAAAPAAVSAAQPKAATKPAAASVAQVKTASKPAAPVAKPAAAPPAAAIPPPAPAPEKPKPAARDEADLEGVQLDAEAMKIKKAFDEKRVIQTFQPVIPLFNTEGADERQVYKVQLQLIDRDGSLMHEDQIYAQASLPAFRKFIDRWLLRETIGRLVNTGDEDYVFVLKISDASLADPSLFNWLRKLLAGLEQRQPGRNIALEMAAGEYSGQEKKAAALMDYLHKSHGFHFVLASSSDIDQARTLTDSKRFNMLRINSAVLAPPEPAKPGSPPPPPAPAGESAFEKIKAGGTRIIVDNVEDSTTLTNVISAGAHYAMGNFIGEPVSQLGDRTNVESFEIT